MKASLNFLHHQDNDWLRELEFYKEELSILTKRLEEAVSKNTDKNVLAQAEHFQNKFVVLLEEVNILKRDIHIREQQIENIATNKPEHIDEKFNTVRNIVLSRMKDLAQNIADTRFEFNRFLSKNL